jgi:hypothetical protein
VPCIGLAGIPQIDLVASRPRLRLDFPSTTSPTPSSHPPSPHHPSNPAAAELHPCPSAQEIRTGYRESSQVYEYAGLSNSCPGLAQHGSLFNRCAGWSQQTHRDAPQQGHRIRRLQVNFSPWPMITYFAIPFSKSRLQPERRTACWNSVVSDA